MFCSTAGSRKSVRVLRILFLEVSMFFESFVLMFASDRVCFLKRDET